MPPGDLDQALRGIKFPTDQNVLVGLDRADDAGVYRVTNDIAIIQTVDFFTPPVACLLNCGKKASKMLPLLERYWPTQGANCDSVVQTPFKEVQHRRRNK